MIYSSLFASLPVTARDAIHERLWQVLSGTVRDPQYRHLSADDRRAIVEILKPTKPGLPASFGDTTK
jgi:hypothetical protein